VTGEFGAVREIRHAGGDDNGLAARQDHVRRKTDHAAPHHLLGGGGETRLEQGLTVCGRRRGGLGHRGHPGLRRRARAVLV